MNKIFIIFVLFLIFYCNNLNAQDTNIPSEFPCVEQDVECISVCHLDDCIRLVFFWDLIQGDWTCLDHRWVVTNMSVFKDGEYTVLAWSDDNENCYRIIRTKCWVESWEYENPLTQQNQNVWFAQLLNPGLKRPVVLK